MILGEYPQVAVVGTGYVGTVVAAGLAATGQPVVGLETDRYKLAYLRSGKVPFYEPQLQDLLATGLDLGRLSFTDDFVHAMARSDVVFLCVGTPEGNGGHPDTRAVEAAARAVCKAGHTGQVIVTKSTVPVGTGHLLASIMEEHGFPPAVVSNPEFLREGSAVDDFLHPNRIVLGSDNDVALRKVLEVYSPILRGDTSADASRRPPALVTTDLVTAETIKYASNAFLATKISFINEIASICEQLGADVSSVATAVGLDSRIGPDFLEAGIGWGGSCFGKDLTALVTLAAQHFYDAPLLRATIEVNRRQRSLPIDRLQRALHDVNGRRVAMLGLSFKPETDDIRDSPAVELAARLADLGAHVTAYDPMVKSLPGRHSVTIAPGPYDAADGAHAVVIATQWPEFLSLDLALLRERMLGNLLVDGRNMFDPQTVAEAGLVYESVGRSPSLNQHGNALRQPPAMPVATANNIDPLPAFKLAFDGLGA